ncbi:MAG: three-Cys-motif partner protein TcmP [Gemmatimonadaceae bacterium]|nr:three-Cys-motif partner protein TcmP [Gemmatimonadaceae bacterium]
MSTRKQQAKQPPIASDGLRARANRAYAEDKLSFIDRYLPPALMATTRVPARVYVDLFAGPGRNVDTTTHEEFDGACLRALRARGRSGVAFTHAVLVNLDEDDHAALEARLDRMEQAGTLAVPRANIRTIHGNANTVVQGLRFLLPPAAYVFAFVDLEKARQWPWQSMQALRRASARMDAYLLFPDDMGLRRVLCYDLAYLERYATALTRFFGVDAWRGCLESRITSGQRRLHMPALAELYLAQLRALGWRHAHVVRKIRLRGDQGLYSMFFLTAHEAALTLVKWEQETIDPQQSLFAS